MNMIGGTSKEESRKPSVEDIHDLCELKKQWCQYMADVSYSYVFCDIMTIDWDQEIRRLRL
jgi:hypothetical protein